MASEALEGGRGREALSSTCHEATAEQVIRWYTTRWSVEVTFRDSKQCLGFEEPQGWSRKAAAVPESWPDYSNTQSRWRRDDDELRTSRACFLAESGWSWEGVPMP